MAYGSVKTTIASGTALSGEVDLRGWRLVGVQFPASWTAADLSVQAAPEVAGVSGTYGEVFIDPGNGTGAALAIDAAASQTTYLNIDAFVGNCFAKIRSGPSGAPVNQAADRVIILLLQKM